jgi:hypothetical protein
MPETNILARIPGEYVVQAGDGLPDAKTATESEAQATIEVLGYRLVVFTFERKAHKRARSTHTWWLAKHARQAS